MWKPMITLNWLLFAATVLALAVVSALVIQRSNLIPRDFVSGTIHGENGFVPIRQNPDEHAPVAGFIQDDSAVLIETDIAYQDSQWIFLEVTASLQGWVPRQSVDLEK